MHRWILNMVMRAELNFMSPYGEEPCGEKREAHIIGNGGEITNANHRVNAVLEICLANYKLRAHLTPSATTRSHYARVLYET
jgi:hypothetical protein